MPLVFNRSAHIFAAYQAERQPHIVEAANDYTMLDDGLWPELRPNGGTGDMTTVDVDSFDAAGGVRRYMSRYGPLARTVLLNFERVTGWASGRDLLAKICEAVRTERDDCSIVLYDYRDNGEWADMLDGYVVSVNAFGYPDPARANNARLLLARANVYPMLHPLDYGLPHTMRALSWLMSMPAVRHLFLWSKCSFEDQAGLRRMHNALAETWRVS